MAAPLSTQARVGRRIVLTVLWTMLLIVGVTIGLLVLVPGIQDSIQRASGAVAGGGIPLSIRAGLSLLRASRLPPHKSNLKCELDLHAQADRGRQETHQHEGTQLLQ